jgi:multiple sugar transport system substrate-binding protein
MPARITGTLIGALLLAAALFFYLLGDDPSQFVNFSTWGTAAEIASFQRLIDHYNATRSPRHRVRLSHGEQIQYTERLIVQAAAGNLPDVMHLDRKDLPLFVSRGMCEALTPYMERDTSFHIADYLPELLPGCKVGTQFYAVPHNFSTLVLYYNKSHFDAEGIAYPDSTWTWDDLLRAALRLTRRDAQGSIVRYGCMMTLAVQTLIAQNDGRVLNVTLDSCIVASPGATGAVQFIVDLSEKYGVSWSMLAQNIQWDDMFAGGRLSMIANGRWAAPWYMRSMQPGSLDAAPLPRGKLRRGGAVNHIMAIASQSSKKEEAWQFVKYLVSEEGQRMLNDDGANIPALRSLVYSDAFLRHHATPTMKNRVFLDELPHSVVWPFEQGIYVTHFVLQSQLELAIRRVLLGQMTATQSLRVMQDNVNGVIRSHRTAPQPVPFMGSVLSYVCGAVAAGLLIVLVRRKGARCVRRG